ncbi:MAG TPA: hypothetical protein VE913_01350 [Longimicrobium sp.]|nr:hypothetical protein [Longimicrobium sp.]
MSAEFFTDRNRGSRRFPEALERAGLIVHRHRDHFVDDVDDDVWLPAVAERGWVALSFDKSIRKNELERDAVFTSGARLIVLTGASADAEQLARNFINTSRKVLEFLEREPAPFIARVKRPSPLSEIGLGKAGTIEMVLSSAEWERKYGW